MRIPKGIHVVTYSLLALSVVIMLSTAYFIFSIKVLEDWNLVLPTAEIHVGDTVTVQSTYHKLREASGESIRYIECKNADKVWIRYELNRATSNRGSGYGGTGIVLTIRRDIADVPTTCKFTVAISYDVLPFRTVHEYNSTKEFTLLPERTDESSLSEPQASTQTYPSPGLPVERSNRETPQSSYPNGTGTSRAGLSDNIQRESNPAPSSSPSLLTRILSPLTNLLGGL